MSGLAYLWYWGVPITRYIRTQRLFYFLLNNRPIAAPRPIEFGQRDCRYKCSAAVVLLLLHNMLHFGDCGSFLFAKSALEVNMLAVLAVFPLLSPAAHYCGCLECQLPVELDYP
jgi:hypothetical protein